MRIKARPSLPCCRDRSLVTPSSRTESRRLLCTFHGTDFGAAHARVGGVGLLQRQSVARRRDRKHRNIPNGCNPSISFELAAGFHPVDCQLHARRLFGGSFFVHGTFYDGSLEDKKQVKHDRTEYIYRYIAPNIEHFRINPLDARQRKKKLQSETTLSLRATFMPIMAFHSCCNRTNARKKMETKNIPLCCIPDRDI